MGARSVVLVTLLLAAARAQAQPAPLSLLDVPYVSQSESLCGGAAAAMVLRYWGERGISAETFAPLVDRSSAGIRTTTLVTNLKERGWNITAVDGDSQLLASELADGRPVIALIEDRPQVYHYIVIIGATERAVIFHDPARAPLRVLTREAFERRSKAAGRWMAVILPSAREASPSASLAPSTSSATTCDQRIALGIAQAQATDLESAGRTLTEALSCPGAAASRELAGVRLLQRRWDDVAQLAEQAVAVDPTDDYAWRLLGTGRFLLNQSLAALDAWNHVSEPRLDLVRVDGLERTRQRPVERLLSIGPGDLISSARFARAQRALRDLPSAQSTRLELVPVPQGLAELHATVVERGTVPHDAWSWTAIGARTAITRTAAVTLGSFSGAGESLSFEWRFWPHRPRIAMSLRAPAPWSGTWGADIFGESQELDDQVTDVRRRGGRFTASRWMTSTTRIEVRGGAERWNTTDTLAAFGVTTGILSGDEHLVARIAVDGWAGSSQFGSASAVATVSSAARTAISGAIPLGLVATVTGGAGVVSNATPFDLWPAGDTGHARVTLARAHPVLDDGRLTVERLGRGVLSASGETQYWWKAPGLSRIAAVAFVDSVRTMKRNGGLQPMGDVDVGGGIGIASLLVPGRVYVNVAHGLRDGADAISVRYVTTAW